MNTYWRWWVALPLIFSSLFLADWVVGEITGEQTESELSVTLQPFDESQEPVLPDDSTFSESTDVIDETVPLAETVPLTATPFSSQTSQVDQENQNSDTNSSSFTSESVAEPQRASGLFQDTPVSDLASSNQADDDVESKVFRNSESTQQPSVKILSNEGRNFNLQRTPSSSAYTTYLGSHTPSLSVDWITPATILIGQEGNYELVIQNPGKVAVEEIILEQVIPTGFELISSSPEPEQLGTKPIWRFQRLDSQREARISLRLVPQRAGDAQSHARVSFTTYSTTQFQVVEPKIELALSSPESVIVGNQVIYTVTISNPGTGSATNTLLHARFPEGLTYVAEKDTYDLGTLHPDESRQIQILADTKLAGDFISEFTVTSDNGLEKTINRQIRALGAELDLSMSGPSFRYVTRPATYSIRLTNHGTAAAQNVRLRCNIPTTFNFSKANHGGRFDAAANTIIWQLGQVNPGDEILVQCTLRAMDQGDFTVLTQVNAERGLQATTEQVLNVKGIAALVVEVVDVDDPVEVGTETFYEILVTNQGTDFAYDVEVFADIPEGIKLIDQKGPTNGQLEGNQLRFSGIPKLAPKADAIFRVMVRGDKAGDFRLKVQATSRTILDPVVEIERTKVYQD